MQYGGGPFGTRKKNRLKTTFLSTVQRECAAAWVEHHVARVPVPYTWCNQVRTVLEQCTTYPYKTVCTIHPWGGRFPSSIARQPRGCRYPTTRFRNASGDVFPTPFGHRWHYSNCCTKSAEEGVIHTHRRTRVHLQPSKQPAVLRDVDRRCRVYFIFIYFPPSIFSC